MAAVVFSDARVHGKVIPHDPNTFPPRIADTRPLLVVSDVKATAAHPVIIHTANQT